MWYLRLSFLKVASHFIIYEGWYILARTVAFARLVYTHYYVAVVYPNRRRISRMKKSRVKSCARCIQICCRYLFTPVRISRQVTMIFILVFIALLNYQRFYNIYFLVCTRTICELWIWKCKIECMMSFFSSIVFEMLTV